MKKTLIFIIMILTAFLFLPLGPALAYQAMFGPTEVLYHDEMQAEDGYVLFEVRNDGTYLIDKEGRICHFWPGGGFRLQDDGSVIGTYRTDEGTGHQEIDWDGNQTWSWTDTDAGRPELASHHDYEPIINPGTGEWSLLVVARNPVSYVEAVAAGCDPDTLAGMDEFADEAGTIPNLEAATPDGVYEINRAGEIIWEWRIWDHVVQSYDPAGVLPNGRSTYMAAAELYPDERLEQRFRIQEFGRLDLNIDSQGRAGLDLDWNHVNSMGYNPLRDEVVVNCRENGEIYVADHSLTTEEAATAAGDFVYRWGNPHNYGMGLPPIWINNGHEQLWGAHMIHWIPQGYPGEGNFLVFENASRRVGHPTYSSSFEINPYAGDVYTSEYVRQEDGGYTDTTNRAYGNLSDQVVWKWSTNEIHRHQHGMYSAHISGTHRCKNGNTLIIAGEPGNILEVTPEAEVVWNYIMPIVGGVAKAEHGPGDIPNLFRAYPIPKDHPGLAGRDLTPGPTLVGAEASGFSRAEDKLRTFREGAALVE